MSSKAIIGISGSWMLDEDGMFPGYARAYVNHDYVRSVTEAGGIPMVLPYVEKADREVIIEQWLEQVDGVILTGGQDLYPPFYGQEARAKLSTVWPERDEFDTMLYQKALEKKVPILGICRGFQLINALRSGELLQDLSYADHELLKHWQAHSPTMHIHEVKFEKGSTFAELFGESAMTNSFHHQAVMRAGEGLKAVGHTSDGVIEAVEDKEHRILATQFHPEMTSGVSEGEAKLFKHFVEMCTK